MALLGVAPTRLVPLARTTRFRTPLLLLPAPGVCGCPPTRGPGAPRAPRALPCRPRPSARGLDATRHDPDATRHDPDAIRRDAPCPPPPGIGLPAPFMRRAALLLQQGLLSAGAPSGPEAGRSDPEAGRRCLVVQRRAGSRHLANAPALLAVLARLSRAEAEAAQAEAGPRADPPRGLAACAWELLPAVEAADGSGAWAAAEAFAAALVVVAPHGGALANLLFAPRGVKAAAPPRPPARDRLREGRAAGMSD